MSRTENIELASLCLLQDGDNYLLQKRAKAGDWNGMFVLPGGHVERDESIVDAVIREVREECGLTLHSPELRGIKQFPIDGGRYLIFLFYADKFEGELRGSDEGAVYWIPKDKLDDYEMAPDSRDLIKVILDPGLTEFMYAQDAGDWQVILK